MNGSLLPFLETFAAVVDAGGFGKAADRLGVSQPAVSYRISSLEEQLDTKLFEPPRRRVILTSAGKRLYAYCSHALTEFDALATELREGRERLETLRVACPGAFGRGVVFPALMELRLDGVQVDLLFRPLEEIFDLVQAGRVDLGIAYDMRVTEDLEISRVAEEEFCLVVPTDADLSSDASLERITTERFVTYEECSYVFGRWSDEVFSRRPVRWHTSMRFSRLEEVIEAVAANRGCTIAPTHAVLGRPVESRVRLVRPSGRPRCYNTEYAVSRPGSKVSSEVQDLLQGISQRSVRDTGARS